MEHVDVKHHSFQKNGDIYKEIAKLIMGELIAKILQIILNVLELNEKIIYH